MTSFIRHSTRPEPDLSGWAITLICAATAVLFVVVMPWFVGLWA